MVKRILELFCGTKSVGKVFEPAGYEVISLDYNPKFNATHTEDILTWNYRQYAPDYFDVVWASPDCTTWSLATSGRYRLKSSIYGLNNEHQEKATFANNMILRVIEILKYFNKSHWFIENPKALLVHYPPLKEYIKEVNAYNTIVYYGNYDNWGFVKPTHIWSNLPLWTEAKPEMNADTYDLKYHSTKKTLRRIYKVYQKGNSEERSKIPPSLIDRLRRLIPNE